MAIDTHGAAAYGSGRQIVSETVDLDGADGLVCFKNRTVVKNMPIGAGVVMTSVSARDGVIEDW